MLIIGHGGAAGVEPANTVASLRAALEAGVDIVEIDVRLTKDKVPVLWHDAHIERRGHTQEPLSGLTLDELQKRTAGTERPVTTLETALKECFGNVLLNIELKQARSFEYSLPVLRKFITKQKGWEAVIFSAFSPAELRRARRAAPHAQLALLHRSNAFLFLRHMRQLRLSAVGFHRLHVNRFALSVAKQMGLFTYAYTVNRRQAAEHLVRRGIDAIRTDHPNRMINNAAAGARSPNISDTKRSAGTTRRL